MRTVYLYVMNTMADWEPAPVMAELNSGRFFKKDAEEIVVKTVSRTAHPITSMGGLTIVPDLMLDDIEVKKENCLILPGSDCWSDPEHGKIVDIAREFLACGAMVAGICGATIALAAKGLLDDRQHTSNGVGFLDMFCPQYQGSEHYVDEPAVRDNNLITAAGTGSLMMARLILEYLDVMKPETLNFWYNYFSSGDMGAFFSLMQTL
ncbi:MAG: type 1 glutamine amidotransferase family protein [Lachnospiraceae bacterium]|nr:type 1 glutamine amidotransferase family protein [Lachnospiraceae bacterium]